MKTINISNNQYMRLFEAKVPPKLSWFINNVYNGKYDMEIFEKMRKRDYKRYLSKYVNLFPLSDEDKQSLYDCMVSRYELILTCIANTAQIGRSIMDGMFDEDISNQDYSWFDQVAESEIVDKDFIKHYIEMRIKFGKKRRLFYGLPRVPNWLTGISPCMLWQFISPEFLLKDKK